MKADVKKAFPGRPDNEIKTREIEVGEVIDGDLAQVAVENGWAEEVKPEQIPDPAAEQATEEEILAYLKGLEDAPEKMPAVKDVSEAMGKKAPGKDIKAAWATFTAE